MHFISASQPWASAAPETLDENKLSSATDVWGFGVTIWEMFTLGGTPYLSQFESFTADFKAALKAGQRLDKPKFASTSLYVPMQFFPRLTLTILQLSLKIINDLRNITDRYRIMKSCWDLDPALRPTFNDLKERFQEELKDAELR